MPTQTVTPDRVATMAVKAVKETAYALAGLADVVVGTVQDVLATHRACGPDCQGTPAERAVRDFVNAIPGQVKGFADEAVEAYRDLAARGRAVRKDGFSSTAHRPAARPADPPAAESDAEPQAPSTESGSTGSEPQDEPSAG